MSDSFGDGMALTTLAFSGAVIGDTLVGTYSIGFSYVGNPVANGSVFSQANPLTGAGVTLTK